MARGLRGVKDDLSEIGRHLVDVACFLAPLIAASSANYTEDSPSPPSSPHTHTHTHTHTTSSLNSSANPNPNHHHQQQQQQQARVIAGAMNDLAEFGGGLKSGIVKLSTALKRTVVRTTTTRDSSSSSSSSGIIGIREELLRFVRDLVKCPESWIEFPVSVHDHFAMSRHQRDHIATVERLTPSLATLRISLCPSFMSEETFWKIYFALIHPRLNKLESELLSSQQIVEEMRKSLRKKMQKNRVSSDESLNRVPECSSSDAGDTQEEKMQRNLNENVVHNRIKHPDFQNHVAESSYSNAGGAQNEAEAEAEAVLPISTDETTLLYIDRWFDMPSPSVAIREIDASTGIRPQLSSSSIYEDSSYVGESSDYEIVER